MFTGIIECTGKIVSLRKKGASAEISVTFPITGEPLKMGESIAVDGVCLTVKSFSSGGFLADISSETLSLTTIARKKAGENVNIERAMSYGGRIGGHFVTGHVDGTGIIKSKKTGAEGGVIVVNAPRNIAKDIIKKGSVAVDGISLTVAEAGEDFFSVALIPHTIENTVLRQKNEGDEVNLETDMLGKYVRRTVESYLPGINKGKISLEFLRDTGFID